MEKLFSWLESFKGWAASQFESINSAAAELTRVKAELEAANITVSEKLGRITELEAAAATHASAISAKDTQIAQLTADLEIEKNRATEAIASQGLNPNNLPRGEAPKTKPSIDHLKGLDKVRAAFAAQTTDKIAVN